MEKTIAAVATPNAAGGISVIRISGENALAVAEKVFKPAYRASLSELTGYTCAFGSVVCGDEEIDEGVATVFLAPKSYTGEDVVEISCHGGVYVTRKVLRAVYRAGAEPAQPGEFTKRAVLNGRISLTQAEAVADMINASSDASIRAAKNNLDGALYKRIAVITEKLTDISGTLAAWADFPEEDEMPDLDLSGLSDEIKVLAKQLDSLLSSYDTGRLIKNGIRTAIVGKPNVGKSTLMNLLAGCEKSIVTDIAGTTRDVVEESVLLGGLVLLLADTAGIRETSDEVEKVGVRLAKNRIESSDLVIAVFDGSEALSQEDKNLISEIKGKRCIAVVNKSDLPQKIDIEYIKNNIKQTVIISAKDSESLKALEDSVKAVINADAVTGNEAFLANERQRFCAQQAKSALEEAICELEKGVTFDAVTVLVNDALSSLLELTGEKADEKIIDNVFSRFCVGK